MTLKEAVALICFISVAISLVIEQIIHYTRSSLKKKKKPPLYEALNKIEAEGVLVGFISSLLTISQDKISAICIPKSVGHSWHPRHYNGDDSQYNDPCLAKGKVQLVSGFGVDQLNVFICILAFTHVLYSSIIYGLGILKMRKWKSWENETKTMQYQYYNDPERFKFTRETSFWSKSPILLWIVCFFRQFYTSVEKVDYLTLRNGFITSKLQEHLTLDSQSTFNFQEYIKRSLEEDFKVIIGIRPLLWFIAFLLLRTNTNGWNSPYWLPFIPLVMLLLVGAKLQVIVTKLGMRILDRGDVIKGSLVVQPNYDDLFWFSRPRFILFLIHIILFENAFQLGFFFWSWYKYGFPSCYHETVQEMIIHVSISVLAQFLCSYVTLPLYALVTQMRSNMKQERESASTNPYSSRPTSPLQGGMSPLNLLQGQRNNNDDNNNNNNNNNNSVESGVGVISVF